GVAGGAELTSRSFELIFRVNDQGNRLVREVQKVTPLTGRGLTQVRRQMTHNIAILHAHSRRYWGAPVEPPVEMSRMSSMGSSEGQGRDSNSSRPGSARLEG
ncbi:unnamed protein product, partial [Discosporangium mesarthrocarpum]